MKKVNIEIDYKYWIISDEPIYKRFIKYLIPFYNNESKKESLYKVKKSKHFNYLKSLMPNIIDKMSARINILSENINHYDWKISIEFKIKKGKEMQTQPISLNIELLPLNNTNIPSFKYHSTKKSKTNNFYFENTSEYKNYVESIEKDDISFYTKIYLQNEKHKKLENENYKNIFLVIENFGEFKKTMESKDLSILRNYDDIFVIYFTIQIHNDILWFFTINPLSRDGEEYQSDLYNIKENSPKYLLTAILKTYFMGDMQEHIDVINDENIYEVLESIKMLRY